MHPETMAVHAGWRRDESTGAVAVPIYQTTAFQFDSSEHAADLFALKEARQHLHPHHEPDRRTRWKSASRRWRAASAALAVASGQAATALAVQNLARVGDNIVTSTDLYGGTWNLFANTFKDQGIEVRFVDPADPEAFVRASDDRTRAWYAETLPNPKLQVFPIAEVAALGRPLGIPLIMDNTAAPMLVRPFDHGAAVVMYSATKYLSGHGTAIAGVIVDGGTFDWAAHPERQPALNTPDASYHGAVWSEAAKPLGPIAYILKARVTLLRDLGPAISPFNAWLVLQGMETLPLRMRRHCATTLTVADWLAERPEVARVIHPAHMHGPRCRAGRASTCRTARAGCWGSNCMAGRRPGGASSTRCSCSTTSPTSATPARWRSTRPAPRTRNWTRATS